MTCGPRRRREDWAKVRIVVDHAGDSSTTVYENYGPTSEIAAWLRKIAYLVHETDITP